MRAAGHRFVLLDAFRGLAALLVVVFHAARDGSPFYRLDPLFLMVDFFFVLSGFVLLPSLPTSFRGFPAAAVAFVGKRVLRLWPMVLAAIAFSAVVYYAHMWWVHRSGAGFDYDINRTPARYAAAAGLLQIWLSKSIFIVVPLWSLSAEWFANVVFAPLAAVRRSIGIVLGVAGGVIMYRYGLATDREWISWIGPIRGWEALGRAMAGFGVGLLVRKAYDSFETVGAPLLWAGSAGTVGYAVTSWVSRWVYLNTPNQVDPRLDIVVGVAAGVSAVAATRGRARLLDAGRLATGVWFILALVAAYVLLDEYRNYGYSVVYAAPVVFGFLVLAASLVSIDPSGLPGRAALTLGAWSFGVYAFHRTVMDGFNVVTSVPLRWYSAPTYMAPNNVWLDYVALKTTVVTVIAIGLTVLTAKFVERPIRSVVRAIAR